jgi:N-acetylglucosaminyldiphosphoundecaprenol N-acetyl-beta-D-mannosaminyltransferase
MPSSPRVLSILGVPCHAVTMEEAVQYVDDLIASGARRQVVLALNPPKFFMLEREEALRGLFHKAALIVPDGIGVVLAHLVQAGERIRRVAGADLMQELCRLAATRGYSVFFYGASEDVSREAASILASRLPGLKIAGRSHGFVASQDMPALVQRINAAQPDILFVALGSPRQERFMNEHLRALDVRVVQGVGGTLDTLAGRVVRAPVLVRKAGLEWLFRLLLQPTRFDRYTILPRFGARILKRKLDTATRRRTPPGP